MKHQYLLIDAVPSIYVFSPVLYYRIVQNFFQKHFYCRVIVWTFSLFHSMSGQFWFFNKKSNDIDSIISVISAPQLSRWFSWHITASYFSLWLLVCFPTTASESSKHGSAMICIGLVPSSTTEVKPVWTSLKTVLACQLSHDLFSTLI